MTPSVTYICIQCDRFGNVTVGTTLSHDAGQRRHLTPGEGMAQSILRLAARAGAPLHHGRENVPALALVSDMLHPEGWGHAVPNDLWHRARHVLDECREASSTLLEKAQ